LYNNTRRKGKLTKYSVGAGVSQIMCK